MCPSTLPVDFTTEYSYVNELTYLRQRVDELADRVVFLEADNERLQEERSALFAALTNQHLTLPERYDGVLTLFEAFSAEPRQDGYREICVRAIAGRAKRSDDAVRDSQNRLAVFGLWDKTTVPGWNKEADRPSPKVLVRPVGGPRLVDNLRALARLAPTPEERAGATVSKEKPEGRTKPGPARGEKRIKRRCPHCGSDDTELVCRNCGCKTHTDELPDETPQPESAAISTEGSTTAVSYGNGDRS